MTSGLTDGMAAPPESVALGLLVALLFGLRHATDPDHITAVAALVLGERHERARRAARLGLAWGAGHGTSLLGFGLPVVAFGPFLPDAAERAAETAIGVSIVLLALRLLLRWRRGVFHSHAHPHDGVWHAHPHAHERPHPDATHPGAGNERGHTHDHGERLRRTPFGVWGVGLLHGIGGSAAAGVLTAAALPTRTTAATALFVYAAATALAMGGLTAGLGSALGRHAVARWLPVVAPVIGIASLLFGVWYAL